ncbi:MAG TPA: acetyl-CoA carboxylase biotin carboxyl carrier protein subunit, partial [Albitalea sp.]|nr:acetyl-CoA carboxylase biotin carboxyl carrier protein subunit [Albitalea sp.]
TVHGRPIDAQLIEQAPDALRVRVAGDTATLRVLAAEASGSVRLALDGAEHVAHIAPLAAGQWHIQIDDCDALITDTSWQPAANDGAGAAAKELRAPFNGRVVALHAAPSQGVASGDTLLVIESMKLEHAIVAPRAATVMSVAVELGQQVATQQLLLAFA